MKSLVPAISLLIMFSSLASGALVAEYSHADLCVHCLANGYQMFGPYCFTLYDPNVLWANADSLIYACLIKLSTSPVCKVPQVINYKNYGVQSESEVALSPGEWCFFDIYNIMYSHYADEALATWTMLHEGNNLKVMARTQSGGNDTYELWSPYAYAPTYYYDID